jgi:4a-hydroxytetrahydrobiopterin dehydratase
MTRAMPSAAPPPVALKATQIVSALSSLPGWVLSGDGADLCIEKSWTFPHFQAAMGFANAVAWIAEQHNHHPEVVVSYHRCTVRWQTHDVQGLSSLDFAAAQALEKQLFAPPDAA